MNSPEDLEEEEFDYCLEELKVGDHYTKGIEKLMKKYNSAKIRAAILEGLYFIIEDREQRREKIQVLFEEIEDKRDRKSRKRKTEYILHIDTCDVEIKRAKRFKKLIEDGKDIDYKSVFLPANHTKTENNN